MDWKMGPSYNSVCISLESGSHPTDSQGDCCLDFLALQAMKLKLVVETNTGPRMRRGAIAAHQNLPTLHRKAPGRAELMFATRRGRRPCVLCARACQCRLYVSRQIPMQTNATQVRTRSARRTQSKARGKRGTECRPDDQYCRRLRSLPPQPQGKNIVPLNTMHSIHAVVSRSCLSGWLRVCVGACVRACTNCLVCGSSLPGDDRASPQEEGVEVAGKCLRSFIAPPPPPHPHCSC